MLVRAMVITLKNLVAGTLFCAVGSMGVYALWIEPYLRQHLLKPSPFSLFLLAPILDYLKARKLSRRRKHTPWFVRVYELLLFLTMLGAIASLILFLFTHTNNQPEPGLLES
jgi:hypothetical protein